MGLVGDPNAPAPVLPTTVTSTDGVVTVTTDDAWGGAHLVVDFSAEVTLPHSVRIWRRTPEGTVAVRGADPNLSPGGISPGYDHEAPLGEVVTWWADALDRDGTVLTTSAEAALTIPWTAGRGTWLKSLASPDLSLRVSVEEWVEGGRDSRTTTYDIAGRASRAATLRTPARLSAKLGIQARDRSEYDAIARLLDSGVLYLDSVSGHGIPSPLHLVRTGDLPAGRPGNAPGWQYRSFEFAVEIIDRPPTTGSPMRTPAASWDSLTYGTWTELGNANPAWLDLANG